MDEDVVVSSSDLFGIEDVDDTLDVYEMSAPAEHIRFKLPYVSPRLL